MYFYPMKKLFSGGLLALLLMLASFTTQAQISDRLVPHSGFMREFITGTPASGGNGTPFSYYNLNLGSYYVLGHVNDVFSYGFDVNTQFGILPFVAANGKLKTNFVIQTPVYAMVRVGANATPYNTQRVGVSLGIGGSFNHISEFTNVNASQRFKTGYIIPDAVAEITFMSRGNPITGRLHVSIADANTNVRTLDDSGNVLTESNFLFSGVGWGLIYGF